MQVNFTDNCFQFMMAANEGNVGTNASQNEWQWLVKRNTNIEYFHIKNAFVLDNMLILFSRGKPQNVSEICCSFLLCMPLVIEHGRVTDVRTDDYTTIKVDQLAYAQNQCEPQVNKKGNDIVLKMP